MLSNGIINTILVVPVAKGITSHVGSKLEGIVTVLRTARGTWLELKQRRTNHSTIAAPNTRYRPAPTSVNHHRQRPLLLTVYMCSRRPFQPPRYLRAYRNDCTILYTILKDPLECKNKKTRQVAAAGGRSKWSVEEGIAAAASSQPLRCIASFFKR